MSRGAWMLLSYGPIIFVIIQSIIVVWLLALTIRAWRYMAEQRTTLKHIEAILYKALIEKKP